MNNNKIMKPKNETHPHTTETNEKNIKAFYLEIDEYRITMSFKNPAGELYSFQVPLDVINIIRKKILN